MDGNRRWAKARFMPGIFGHKAGFDNLKKITKFAHNKWIKYLTVWALSTENLQKRGKDEISGIVKIIDASIKLLPEFMKEEVRIKTIGDIQKLPVKSQEVLAQLVSQTAENTWITLCVALVYWGQNEIIRATQKIIESWIDPKEVTPEVFRSYLDTAGLPLPDVIVRTWGDIRHSGFLLYDSAYSEYYFTDKKWPEFDEAELDAVINFFEESQRNFWK